WRDTAIECRGPSVGLLQESFDRIWRYADCGGPIHRAEFVHSRQSLRGEPRGRLFGDEPAAHARQLRRSDSGVSPLDIEEDSFAVLASVPTPRSQLLPSLHKLLQDTQ